VERIEKGELFRLFGGQADFFLMFLLAPLAAAVLLWSISKKVQRLMHGLA
jgi:hypothetical protein